MRWWRSACGRAAGDGRGRLGHGGARRRRRSTGGLVGGDRQHPPAMLALYQAAAATCPGLPWTILAAIGTVESDNGQSTLPGVHSGANAAGAEGPMQFEPATFAEYDEPVPPGGAVPPSPYDPTDAVYAAARLLCANGGSGGPTSPVPSTPTTTRRPTSPRCWRWPSPGRAVRRRARRSRAPAQWRWRGRCPRSARPTSGAARPPEWASTARVSSRPPTGWPASHSPGWPRTSTTPHRSWPPVSRSRRATSSSSAAGPTPSTTSGFSWGWSMARTSWSTLRTRAPTCGPSPFRPPRARPSGACSSWGDDRTTAA